MEVSWSHGLVHSQLSGRFDESDVKRLKHKKLFSWAAWSNILVCSVYWLDQAVLRNINSIKLGVNIYWYIPHEYERHCNASSQLICSIWTEFKRDWQCLKQWCSNIWLRNQMFTLCFYYFEIRNKWKFFLRHHWKRWSILNY